MFLQWDHFSLWVYVIFLFAMVFLCNLIIFLDNFSIMSKAQFVNAAFKTGPFSDSHSNEDTETLPRTPLSSISSSLNEQSKQRMVSKYERQLKIKDNELTALGSNLTKFKQELAKSVLENQTIKQENQSLQERLDRMDRTHQDSHATTTKEYELKISNQSKEINLLQATISGLMEQVAFLQDRQAVTQRQQKVAMRRWNNTLEQTRSQLQGKLSIKQKQQEKIESLLELKKKELDQRLNDKDQEVVTLERERQTLREQRDRLHNELMTVQTQKMEEYRLFSAEIKSMEQSVIQTRKAHAQLIKDINDSLLSFKTKLDLTSEDDDLVRLIQKLQQELSIRKDPSSYQQAIAKYQQQIHDLLLSEKDLKNRIAILEDEMAFIRTRNARSHDFRAAIESHMQQLDSKIAPLTAKKTKPIEYNKCDKSKAVSIVPAVLPITLKERPPANPLNTLNANISNSLQLPKVTADYDTDRVGRGRSANDFLKEELQSKKKSLIYLMYRPQHDQQNHPFPPPHPPHKETFAQAKPSAGEVRRRSNSLGNLISAKCRQRIS